MFLLISQFSLRLPLFHGRKLTTRRYSPLLDEDNTLLFYIKKPLYSRFKGKFNKKGERDPESTSPSPKIFPHCEDAVQHNPRPSQGTLTRPVRSRTSPIILNTNYTDKDRKPNEQPHGDPSAHKEPTRPSERPNRTSSYLNSFSPNWRPQDKASPRGDVGGRKSRCHT